MNEVVRKLSLVIGVLLAANSFAGVSGELDSDPKKLYCPEKIVCAEDGNVESCKYLVDGDYYWDEIEAPNGVAAGTYNFFKATSLYHDPPQYRETVGCLYKQTGNGREVKLKPKIQANLEAFYDKNTKWAFVNNSKHNLEC